MLNDAFVADSPSSSSSMQKSHEAGSVPASMPLYSQSMWAVHRSSTDTANFGAFKLICNPRFLLLARHQQGLDYLQERSSSRDSRIIYITYSRQLEFNSELMNHQYGRFDYQLREVTLKITHERLFLRISTDKHGSSLINKLIKALANLLLVLLYVMATLNRLFKFLMMSTFGSSVILQCLHPLYKKKL